MVLNLLPLGADLRREAAQIVGRSADRNLTAEEWAEVRRLRSEADRLDGGFEKPEVIWDPAPNLTMEEIQRIRAQPRGQSVPGLDEPPGAPLWREAETIRERARLGEASDEELERMKSLFEESLRLNDQFYAAKTAASSGPRRPAR
jgi:hypothetical protein